VPTLGETLGKILSADAVEFFPKDPVAEVTRDELMCFNQSLLDQIGSLQRENETLIQELKDTHTASRTLFKGQAKEIDELHESFASERLAFKKAINEESNEKELLREVVVECDEAYKNALFSLKSSEKEWIGRTLKFQYLFEQMGRIGIQQSEDIFDCFRDIEVPEVSVAIKDEFVTTTATDNIDFVDEESDFDDEPPSLTDDEDEDEDGEWTRWETITFQGVPYRLRHMWTGTRMVYDADDNYVGTFDPLRGMQWSSQITLAESQRPNGLSDLDESIGQDLSDLFSEDA